MDFIALTGFPLPFESDLNGAFLAVHRSGERQQSESGHALHIAFYLMRVEYFLSHHLESAADADDGLAVVVSLENGLCTTVSAQFHQVGNRAFGTGKDQDIGLFYFFCVISIEKVYTTILLQHIEIGEIAQMPKHDYGDIYLSSLCFHILTLQRNTVFLLDVNVLEIGKHS